MNYIVNIFTANSDTSKLTGKIQLAWWFYPITIFTLTVGNNKWLKIKWTFIWHWSFSQRTNNSEEMDFNTKPELRVRTHLRSLFINLRPVWLQSDDSVEFVQGQVSILYVLAGWQESGGGWVWGGVGQLHSHSPPQSQKEKEKKGHLTTFHLWRAGREKAARWNLHWLNCTMTHCHLRLWLSAKLSTAIVQGTKRIPEARGN